MKTKPKNKNILNEPDTPRLKKHRIQFFSSFEEMNESDAQSKAKIRPLDHLKNNTKLIVNIYSEELKKPMNKKIKFRE